MENPANSKLPRIMSESGLASVDRIRETLRSFCNVDDTNIAFAIVEIDGKKQTLVALDGVEPVPGTMPTPETSLLEPKMNLHPANTHAVFKILELLAQRYKHDGTGHISLFVEQAPCEESCNPIINFRFPKAVNHRITVSVTSVYPDSDARRQGVASRVEKMKQAK